MIQSLHSLNPPAPSLTGIPPFSSTHLLISRQVDVWVKVERQCAGGECVARAQGRASYTGRSVTWTPTNAVLRHKYILEEPRLMLEPRTSSRLPFSRASGSASQGGFIRKVIIC